MPMDTFNVVAGLVTIGSFVFSLVLFIQDRTLRRNLEAGLTGLIGTLDTLAHYAKETSVHGTTAEERALAGKALGYAVASRNHAIALLKSFTDREQRFRTFDFGIEGKTPAVALRKRKKDFECALTGQDVCLANGTKPVDELVVGDGVLAYDIIAGRLVPDEIVSVRDAIAESHIKINGSLAVTTSHELWCPDRGWVAAGHLCVGDSLITSDGGADVVTAVELVRQPARVFAISVRQYHCYFVGGYLAHNK